MRYVKAALVGVALGVVAQDVLFRVYLRRYRKSYGFG